MRRWVYKAWRARFLHGNESPCRRMIGLKRRDRLSRKLEDLEAAQLHIIHPPSSPFAPL